MKRPVTATKGTSVGRMSVGRTSLERTSIERTSIGRWTVGLSAFVVATVAVAGCMGNVAGSGAMGATGAGGGTTVTSGATGGAPATAGTAGTSGGASRTLLGPAAGRLLTRDEYINTVRDILGVDLAAPADTNLLIGDQPATGGGFRNDIAALFPSSVRTNAYENVATLIAQRVAWTGVLATHATCTSPTAACREGFVRHLGRVMYRGQMTDADVGNLVPLFDAAGSTDAAGFQIGARLVLEAMLQSSHFLYRLERLDSLDGKSGLPGPNGFEMATRVSFLIWQSAPSPAVLDAAERGAFSDNATSRAAIQGMLADPRAQVGFEGYARDWLQLYRLDERTTSLQNGVTDALIAEMKQETLRFVDRIAFTEKRDLAALFTDKTTELGPALAQVYGITPSAQGFATYDLSQNPNRLGILTQPGFLILRAAPEAATIVHRGLMVMRVFLCAEVPAPPANAASMIDSVPANLTDRDRFAMHTASPACSVCHQAFDPLGFPFEPFDLAGRFRTNDSFGNVLRSDGAVNLDGTSQAFKNTAEFSTLLGRSATVQRCFIRKMYQYGAGRALEVADEAGVADVAAQFLSAGRTYVAAATAVAASPGFRAMAPIK